MLHRLFGPALVSVALTLCSSALAQQSPQWNTYFDPQYAFSAELPYGQFEPLEESGAQGLTLTETGGSGQISIYGGDASGLTLDGFVERLSAGPDVRRITYQASGESWFVLSGFFEAENTQTELIFYTKVLLSSDRQTFSAFEISYEAADKSLYDAIVNRIEASFTRPPSY